MNAQEQVQTLRRLLSDGLDEAELRQLDARRFDGWRRLVVFWVKSGGDRQAVLASLDMGQRGELDQEAAACLEADGGVTTWADMAQKMGPLTWSWPGWLPNGHLVIMAAAPGVGKSALCLRLAATIVRGDPWPDGERYAWSHGSVLWGEAEAAQGINLERARQWGLPLDKLVAPLGNPLEDIQLDNPAHLSRVAQLAHRPEIRLIVIDSLRGANSGDENSSESIRVVKELATIARDSGKPIILTHHLRKKGALDTSDVVELDRVRGSSAIVQPARVVWGIDVPNPREQTRRLAVIKNNLGGKPEPLGFTIGATGIESGQAPESQRRQSDQERAVALLPEILCEGPRLSDDVRDQLREVGISFDAAKRVKGKLGIVSFRRGVNWYWGSEAEAAEFASSAASELAEPLVVEAGP
jgi:hypothetical protein